MASSNAGTSFGRTYQVFLSFRGPDTRIGFTNVLYHCLTNAGIYVFQDDEELRVGEEIAGSLAEAINDSIIYIPVFSQTYASSRWCLCELAHIMANISKSEGNKKILPIFFDVDPNDVELKSPLYRNAIIDLECKKNLDITEVDGYRDALKKVGAIKGWEVKKYSGQGELIDLVVEEVMKKLKKKHRLGVGHVVGIDHQVEAVSKLLDINSGGVRFIQIHGMSGIGKSTLAKVVFNRVCTHFGKHCCFLKNVQEKSLRSDGLLELEKKILYEMGVRHGSRRIDEADYGMKRTGEVLCNKKVLIVLDDIDKSDQVWNLLGVDSLYPGSRILITTKNVGVLRPNRSKYQILDYAMEMMSFDSALEFFKWHAFNIDSPNKCHALSKEIVFATGRLPLALEVIGSFLYDKPQEIWEETLEKLKIAPHKDVFGKLKISYDALTFEQREIFLDIACFFNGEDYTNAVYMWKDLNFFPHTEVHVLKSMSLVKIVETNKFWMHDQLRKFGRQIVQQENRKNPGERIRIWIREEILGAIRTTKMKDKVQALDLDLCRRDRRDRDDVIISKEIGKFEHLKYFKLNGGTFDSSFMDQLTELRWFSWSDPAHMARPSSIHLKNVVVLQFSNNHSIENWNLQIFVQVAGKLKVLSLKSCHRITTTPDFSKCPNLEKLTLEDCSHLRKIHGSIGKLKSLINLKISRCCHLVDLAEEIGNLVNLRHFFVQRCGVNRLPDYISKLKSLREVHFLGEIDKVDLANSWELPSTIGMLPNLEVLIVNHHFLKGQLPSAIGSLPSLRILNLSHTHVSEVPKTVNMLSCLERLELMSCDKIQGLPALPTSLTHLQVSSTSLRRTPNLSNLTNLVELCLDDGGGGNELFTDELWQFGPLSKLTKLTLGLHNVPAPTELASLAQLNQLDLFRLNLQTIPHLPLSLQKLCFRDLNSIVSIEGLQLPHLTELLVQDCETLERFSLSGMRKLKYVQVRYCPKLVEVHFSRAFETLEALSIECCESLGRVDYADEAGYDNIESANELISCEGILTLQSRVLNKLQSFTLWSCHKILEIQAVGTLESLEHFEEGDMDVAIFWQLVQHPIARRLLHPYLLLHKITWL